VRLTPEQVRETLRRHGLPETTEVLGISYDSPITVNINGERLAVPADVLAVELVPTDPKRKTLFSRPD
jgi:hypothetical protein